MTKKQQKEVDKIVNVLRSQKFYDFYVSDDNNDGCLFDDYLQFRSRNLKLKEAVEEKIKELFEIK